MRQGAIEFDPLAALEAEYAAVLAQTKRPEASTPAQDADDAESAGSDSEEEGNAAVGGFESYALLPSSPCNSNEASPSFEDNKEDTERPQQETKLPEVSTQKEDAEGLQEDKKQAIMQTMQQVKLRPPPWAEAANLTDDELVNLVHKQLGLKEK